MSEAHRPSDRGGTKPDPQASSAESKSDSTIRFDSDALRRYAEAQQRKGSLLVIDGVPADVGRHLVVETSVVIGRETAGLQLCDGRISRQHAIVEQLDDQHVLHDLGSTNGTLINGALVAGKQTLREGDQILVGQSLIKFTLVDSTEATYLRRMQQLAGTDHLTGLPAKHRFDSLLQEAMRSADQTGQPLTLLMMDLDGLKAINDAHGHQMGAQTIRQVGQHLGRFVARRGEACRFGGDEFCMFLRGQPLATAMELAREICRSVREVQVAQGGRSVRPTISVGVAERPPGMLAEAQLLELADRALYRAKAAGRDTVSD